MLLMKMIMKENNFPTFLDSTKMTNEVNLHEGLIFCVDRFFLFKIVFYFEVKKWIWFGGRKHCHGMTRK